ncbi:MAG: glycosyltransferase family 2 protein, partial [Chloroflexota bacterium]
LKAARGQVIVTTDSDGTYDFASIPRLLAALEPGIDVVTASPYHPQGGVGVLPAYRLALSRGCSMIYRLL